MKTINSNWNCRELKEIVTINGMRFKIVTGLLNGGGSNYVQIISNTNGLCQILDKGDINGFSDTRVSYVSPEEERSENAESTNLKFRAILEALYGEEV